jgi:2-hydroxychromene-2-carboxylate isomerase
MRSVCAVEDHQKRGELMRLYFKKAWSEGESLEDLDVLRACLAELEIDQDPDEASSRRECRAELKANTKLALEKDVWGVPTFMVDDLVFFGHDRLGLLRAYLDDYLSPSPGKLTELLSRPQPGRLT